jgi:TRAP-type C4-dicarboxylate transport system substrate-binding protein
VITDPQFVDRFLSLAEDRGIKGLGLIVYGPAGFASRTPIRTPDDMKGKKLRVLATPIEMAMLASLGATGVPMPLGEVLAALQQGAIDGSESAITVFTTFKYFDIVKYYTNTNHYFITSIATVSKRWFDGLPADIQKIVVEETRAIQAEILAWGKDFNRAAVAIWKDKTKDGLVELTPEQRATFRSRMEGVDVKVAQDVPGIKEWLDLLRARAKALQRGQH